MYLPLWTTLSFAARHNGLASVQRTNPSDVCLPPQLQTAVPTCAVQCLQTYIANNYNVHSCTSTADLTFLCTNPSSSGLTIGEGSLQCVISSCLNADLQTQSGYTVCDGTDGALPNMAETITATISAITTLLSSSETSLPTATSESVATTTSDLLSSVVSSEVPVTSLSLSTVPITSPTPSRSLIDVTSSEPIIPSTTLASVGGSETSVPAPDTVLSSVTSTLLPTNSSSAITPGTSSTKASTSSRVSRTATSSATAAAATESATQSGLGSSAIAGIATSGVLVLALILGYIAYWFCVKRGQRRRRSQEVVTTSVPQDLNPSASTPSRLIRNTQARHLNNSSGRFYASQSIQENRRSFWRRSAVPSNDIGVAVAPSTRVSPESHIDVRIPDPRRISWPSSTPIMQIDRSGPKRDDGRWSSTASFNDDLEAQGQIEDQDLPALASPRTRASSRSFSSIGIEKLPPLQLTGSDQRPELAARGLIPLTPVYDNGTFDPTIRQVPKLPKQAVGLVRLSRDKQTPNFSRREPSLTRTSQDDTRSKPVLNRQPSPIDRYPVKPVELPRKQSATTERSISIHTEFDEDSTPEGEDDKELKIPSQVSLPKRVPPNNVRYPQIPRPAATRRQAETPHSPRALTIRQVHPSPTPTPPQQPSFAARVQMASKRPDLAIPNLSSNSSLASRSSESAVFPTPPPRNPARLTPTHLHPQGPRPQFVGPRRIAPRPQASARFVPPPRQRNNEFPPTAYPSGTSFGGQYDSPSLQRLSTGRIRGKPSGQRGQVRGRMAQPPMQMQQDATKMVADPPIRSRAIDPRSADLYFTVGDVGS